MSRMDLSARVVRNETGPAGLLHGRWTSRCRCRNQRLKNIGRIFADSWHLAVTTNASNSLLYTGFQTPAAFPPNSLPR